MCEFMVLAQMGLVGIVVIVFVVLLIFWFLGMYNGLVRLKNQVKNAWSQIDVQLKRRYDLIPNLVESAKGYMKFEQETLENVTKARNMAMQTSQGPQSADVEKRAEAETMLNRAMSQFFVVVEKYPDLKANQNVQSLMEELTSTENKISFARQYYNDTVTRYNTKQEVIPSNIVAKFGPFKQETLFQIEEVAREAPKVSFS